ncbi:hypothetical protein GCM10018953_71750 [Streptosporangium nondiastaticum]
MRSGPVTAYRHPGRARPYVVIRILGVEEGPADGGTGAAGDPDDRLGRPPLSGRPPEPPPGGQPTA